MHETIAATDAILANRCATEPAGAAGDEPKGTEGARDRRDGTGGARYSGSASSHGEKICASSEGAAAMVGMNYSYDTEMDLQSPLPPGRRFDLTELARRKCQLAFQIGW